MIDARSKLLVLGSALILGLAGLARLELALMTRMVHGKISPNPGWLGIVGSRRVGILFALGCVFVVAAIVSILADRRKNSGDGD